MRNWVLGFAAFALFVQVASAEQGVPRVSVTRFRQEVDHVFEHCRGWAYDSQNHLQTELERELSEHGLKVLERRDIRGIYQDEFQLSNMDQKSVAKRNKFLAAQYTVTGAVTELGICEEGAGTAIQLGGIVSLLGGPATDLAVGRRKAVSKVTLVAQVVSVETGEIIKSFEAKAEVADSAVAVEGSVAGIGGHHASRSAPPIEKASNQAIRNLAGQIGDFLVARSN